MLLFAGASGGKREREKQIFGLRMEANCQIFVYVITFGLMVQFMDFATESRSLPPHSLFRTKWHRLKYKTSGRESERRRIKGETLFTITEAH